MVRKLWCHSGVTRVGNTKGGNWGCHPIYFFLRKLATFFAHHCHFLLISLGCHPLEGVTTHLFLPFRPRFSTILCKFAPTKFFPGTRWRVSPGVVPPCDATLMSFCCVVCVFKGLYVMSRADGESFVSALYNKYESTDQQEQEIKIYVPKSAPGCTSMWNVHLILSYCCRCIVRLTLSSHSWSYKV